MFTLFNCAPGLLYGSPFVKPHSTMILTINGAGFVLETFYLISFLTFAPRKKKVNQLTSYMPGQLVNNKLAYIHLKIKYRSTDITNINGMWVDILSRAFNFFYMRPCDLDSC